jgi:16S rRNA G527 N7-methylase RsmG
VLSISEIRDLLTPYAVTLDDPVIEQIQTYLSLLLVWNKKISLTALEDPREIIQMHFGESFAAINLGPISGRLADVGTGAGFPGLPLKLISPSIHVTLIEPNQKKCAFLHELVRNLKLTDVEIFRGRFEDYPLPVAQPSTPPPDTVRALSMAEAHAGGSNSDVLFAIYPSSLFHTITSRALSRTPALLSFCSRALLPSGRLLLWLTPHDAPSIPATSWRLSPPFPLPFSPDRLILPATPYHTSC